MSNAFIAHLRAQIDEVKANGLYKSERIITSQQQGQVAVGERDVLNFCANNYLGLANHPDIIAAAKEGLDSMALVWHQCDLFVAPKTFTNS